MFRYLLLLAFIAVTWLPAYDLLLISDTHYDAPELRPGLSGEPNKSIRRNFTAWQRMPAFQQFYRRQAASGVDFVIHCGDIAHGYFSKKDDILETRAVTAGLAAFTDGIPVPLYCVKGNHEDACVNPSSSSEAVLAAYLRRLNLEPERLNYALMHRGDLFIFADATRPDLSFIRRTLAAHTEAKRVFFVTHFPVLPSSCGNPSRVFCGKKKQEKALRELLSLLAKRRAVVICGHIHQTTLTRAEFPDGPIVQLSVYSLQVTDKQKPSRKEWLGDKCFTGYLKPKSGMPFLPHLQKIFTGSYRRFQVFYPACGLHRLQIGDKQIACLQFAPDGKLLHRIVVAE